MEVEKNPYLVLIIEHDPKQAELYSELIREVALCQIDIRADAQLNLFANYHLVLIGQPKILSSQGRFKPEVRVLALIEQMKRLSPLTSVIAISEHATVSGAVSAIRLGAEDYLKKPFHVDAFKLSVKRGLDRKVIFSENVSASAYLSLLHSCQMISASLELDKIFGVVQSYLARELNCAYTAVYTLQGAEAIRVDTQSLVRDTDATLQEVLQIALDAVNPLLQMVEAGESLRFIERGQFTPAMFVFRFKCAGQSDYFLIGLSPSVAGSSEAFESRVKILRTQLELTGKNIEQYQGIQHLVYVDDATGLYNTRYLGTVLDKEITLATETKQPFAVLFIDADKFKLVNDANGHLVGTRLLFELGDHLKRFVRTTDTVFRYGGDEFIAVLSPCDLRTAEMVAERIRKSVEERIFLEGEGLNIQFTVSIGVALFPDHAQEKRQILDAADKAMYNAKKNSRNQVFIASIEKSNVGG